MKPFDMLPADGLDVLAWAQLYASGSFSALLRRRGALNRMRVQRAGLTWASHYQGLHLSCDAGDEYARKLTED